MNRNVLEKFKQVIEGHKHSFTRDGIKQAFVAGTLIAAECTAQPFCGTFATDVVNKLHANTDFLKGNSTISVALGDLSPNCLSTTNSSALVVAASAVKNFSGLASGLVAEKVCTEKTQAVTENGNPVGSEYTNRYFQHDGTNFVDFDSAKCTGTVVDLAGLNCAANPLSVAGESITVQICKIA